MSAGLTTNRDVLEWKDQPSAGAGEDPRSRALAQATWVFVGLGMLLRIARYAMNYPLWWDEAFVAVNFIRRDYFDLLRPLDYGQVCPVLFLWAELAVVKLLGFSEWSLRLFPLACSVASVPLFRYAAGRVVRGVSLLLAVAIFAVSYHPIRHAADVKPYASDLLAAVAVLALASTGSAARRGSDASGRSRVSRQWCWGCRTPRCSWWAGSSWDWPRPSSVTGGGASGSHTSPWISSRSSASWCCTSPSRDTRPRPRWRPCRCNGGPGSRRCMACGPWPDGS